MEKIVAMLPVYNEEKAIASVLERSRKSGIDFFIIVNDGSRDSSESIILDWIKKYNNSLLISFSKNQGIAKAKELGMSVVCKLLSKGFIKPYDVIVKYDTDGQHRPEYIPELLKYMREKDLDFLLTRRDFSKYPFSKKIGNMGISFIATLLTGKLFYDSMSGLKLIKASLIPQILSYYSGYRYAAAQEISMIPAYLKYKIDNRYPIEIDFYKKGASIRDGFSVFRMSVKVFLRYIFKRSEEPYQKAERNLKEFYNDISRFPEINKLILE
ncbi:MAG: glycosyltransferase family 2 protein [Actinobacteria bacterium]|nr:glycosyltransferase family 2 protein [Actinomycetota bacterium]